MRSSAFRITAVISMLSLATYAIVACSSDDTTPNPTPDAGGIDSAKPDTGAADTGPGTDAGVDANDGAAPYCEPIGIDPDTQIDFGSGKKCLDCARSNCCAETTACLRGPVAPDAAADSGASCLHLTFDGLGACAGDPNFNTCMKDFEKSFSKADIDKFEKMYFCVYGPGGWSGYDGGNPTAPKCQYLAPDTDGGTAPICSQL